VDSAEEPKGEPSSSKADVGIEGADGADISGSSMAEVHDFIHYTHKLSAEEDMPEEREEEEADEATALADAEAKVETAMDAKASAEASKESVMKTEAIETSDTQEKNEETAEATSQEDSGGQEASRSLSITDDSKTDESKHEIASTPDHLLVVCDAMAALVKDDDPSAAEMNRLTEQIFKLFGAVTEERNSLQDRLEQQEVELLKNEEKIGVLEDEIEKQLADWDMLEVKLGQADSEIRKLLAENEKLGNELQEGTKNRVLESWGDPSDFSAVNDTIKQFSAEIATAKSELEEAQKRMETM
jgi:hypothetical protein